jgi:hypothetical protein
MPAYDFVINVDTKERNKTVGILNDGLNSSIVFRLKLNLKKKANPNENVITDKSIKIITHRGRNVSRLITF